MTRVVYLCIAASFLASILLVIQVSCGSPGGRSRSSVMETSKKNEEGRNLVKAGKDGKSCKFREKDYMPGERWAVNASGTDCVVCQCYQMGHFNCTMADCCDESVGTSRGINASRRGSSSGKGLFSDGHNASLRSEGSRVCCRICSTSSRPASLESSARDAVGRYKGREVGENYGKMSETATISSPEYNRQTTSPLYEFDSDLDSIAKSDVDRGSCLHNNRTYRDNEMFAANMSGSRPWISNLVGSNCMHCKCQDGTVICNVKHCSSLNCRKKGAGQEEDACCNNCKGNDTKPPTKGRKSERGKGIDMNDFAHLSHTKTSAATPDGVTRFQLAATLSNSKSAKQSVSIHPLVASGKRAGCTSAGKYYMHGATWHPIIGPFGSMECVNCKCVDGRIDCSRKSCRSPSPLWCQNLVKLDGYCCPICMTAAMQNGLGPVRLCAPIYENVTVYQSQEYFPDNSTEFASLSFVRAKGDRNPKSEVEVHEWILVEGRILKFKTTLFTTTGFMQYKNNKNIIVLGVTTNRNLEKFTKREKKLHVRCKAQCNLRLKSIQLTLRLHGLVTREKCLSDERAVF